MNRGKMCAIGESPSTNKSHRIRYLQIAREISFREQTIWNTFHIISYYKIATTTCERQ